MMHKATYTRDSNLSQKRDSSTWPGSPEIWPLVRSSRKQEAHQIFQQLCRREAKTDVEYGRRADIAMCLGEWDQAYQDFRKLHEMTSLGRTPPLVGVYLSEIGVIEWIRGNYDEAKRLWRAHIDGLTDGIIGYSDNAGGVKPGCFLWFGGVASKDKNAISDALKYLKGLASKSRIRQWPGPVAMLISDKMPFDAVVEQASTNSPLILETAGPQPELLTRRHLCEALFYGAIKSLAGDQFDQYMQRLHSCAELENPLIELEWYLANHELKRTAATT